MEKRIRSRFNPFILNEAAGRFGTNINSLHELDGFENFMFEFPRGGGEFILRIAHSSRRSEALILGEVDWIHYLADRGVQAARAIRSENGRIAEAVDDGFGDQFLATAFIKADGVPPREAGWSPGLYLTYGRLLGRMHALSKQYQLPVPDWKRPEWDDHLFQDIERNLPASEKNALDKYEQILEHVSGLPKNPSAYGLIHFDAHGGNMLVDHSGEITLFDFDDCLYNWFINDIAIVLFYITLFKENQKAFVNDFLKHFLSGYYQENQLDPVWFKEIPYFLKMREIDLYAVIHRSFDVENLEDPWNIRYMQDRKFRIENDVPVVDFDFDSIFIETSFR